MMHSKRRLRRSLGVFGCVGVLVVGSTGCEAVLSPRVERDGSGRHNAGKHRSAGVRSARQGNTFTTALRNDGADWKIAKPGYAWTFPRDHWAHEGYRTEWWYFTGHLDDVNTGAPRFAFQITFFKVGLAPNETDYDSNWSTDSLVMAHFALSDIKRQEHRFSESLHRVVPGLAGIGVEPDPELIWVRAPAGTDGRWTLTWNGTGFDLRSKDTRKGFAIDLQTEPTKPLIFQGPEGLSRKGEKPTQASLYYSFTRLATRGTVQIDGETVAVQGESWMDKEFGSSMLGDHQVGWDWFSLQLNDDEELMLYVLRDRDGGVDHASGTRVFRGGHVEYFDERKWTLRVTREWRAPAGATYPVAWFLNVAGRSLKIESRFDDQENRGSSISDLAYWEGAVSVRDASGTQVGRGFVEMTGYNP